MLKYGKYVLISQHDADKADTFFQRWGTATAFFSRLMPVVRTYISLPAGITKMSPIKFSIYTFLGSLPWCLLLAYLGYILGNNYEQISGPLHYLDGGIVFLVVVLVVLYVWRHIRNDRRARAEHAAAVENAPQPGNNPWDQPQFQGYQSPNQQPMNQSQFQAQNQQPMSQPQFQAQNQQPMNQPQFQGYQSPNQPPFQGQPVSGQSSFQNQPVPPPSAQPSWGQPPQQWGQQQSAPQWGRPSAPPQVQPPQGNNPAQGNVWQH